MALELNLESSSDVLKEEAVCHLIPCKIKHNGQANVSKYFSPSIREEGEVNYNCSFRGRPLQGQKIAVPNGYRGIVMEEKATISDSGDKREMKMTRFFQSFTSWNWDKVPSDNDKIITAFQWMDVAAALHKPVDNNHNEIDSPDKEQRQRRGKRKLSVTDDTP